MPDGVPARKGDDPDSSDRITRSPSVPSIHGHDLDWLIEQYLDDRRDRVDTKTHSAYECRLRIVIQWWSGVGPAQHWRLKASDLEAFERYLRSRPSANTGNPLSYTYRAGILQSLREVLRWASENGYIRNDYSSWVPPAAGGKMKRRAASEDELLRLLAECDNSPRRVRDRAIVAVFIGMGLRRAEVTNLKVEDLHFTEDGSGHANVRGKRTKATPDGKRDAAFDAATGQLIADHIAAQGTSNGPLFVSYRGKPVATYTLYGIVKKLIVRAGLEGRIQACHDLRRAFTTYWARQKGGADSADLRRRQLGHSEYSQTAEYTLYEIDDIRADIVSPVSKLIASQACEASRLLSR